MHLVSKDNSAVAKACEAGDAAVISVLRGSNLEAPSQLALWNIVPWIRVYRTDWGRREEEFHVRVSLIRVLTVLPGCVKLIRVVS